jgi:hypothetical protein
MYFPQNTDLSSLISARIALGASKELAFNGFRVWIFDNLIPDSFLALSSVSQLSSFCWRRSSTFNERKYTFVDFHRQQPASCGFQEALLYSFQQSPVVSAIALLTGISGLVADPSLYAGGISLMNQGCFLCPHIDNSHDGSSLLYRRLNLLFYTNDPWNLGFGGELLLYPNGPFSRPLSISPTNNRLVIMETNTSSWHGVARVLDSSWTRICYSNYYFAPDSYSGTSYYHPTFFTPFNFGSPRMLPMIFSNLVRYLGRFKSTAALQPLLSKCSRRRSQA